MRTQVILTNCSNPIIRCQAFEIAESTNYESIEIKNSIVNRVTNSSKQLVVEVADTLHQLPTSLMKVLLQML